MLPFHDRFIKELRVNEMDSCHIVFVRNGNPTIVTQTNCDVESFKVTHFGSLDDQSFLEIELVLVATNNSMRAKLKATRTTLQTLSSSTSQPVFLSKLRSGLNRIFYGTDRRFQELFLQANFFPSHYVRNT